MRGITILKNWILTLFFGTFIWLFIFAAIEIFNKGYTSSINILLSHLYMALATLFISFLCSLPLKLFLIIYAANKKSEDGSPISLEHYLNLYVPLSILILVLVGIFAYPFALVGLNYFIFGLMFSIRSGIPKIKTATE